MIKLYDFDKLSPAEIFARTDDSADVAEAVRGIIEAVKAEGDMPSSALPNSSTTRTSPPWKSPGRSWRRRWRAWSRALPTCSKRPPTASPPSTAAS